MNWLWWMLVGVAVGVIVMLPVCRLLLRRGERRARDAERRALDSERLAELGAMTSGLAHEIKNPLSTIGLNAQLLREGLDEAEMDQEHRGRLARRLDALRREVSRLSDILTDFLQFAGRVKLDPRPHDLVQLVDELADFFHPQCDKAGIVLRTQLPREPVIAQLDEALTKQAILNLMVNATQAMRGQGPSGQGPGGQGPGGQSDRPREIMLRVSADGDCARVHVIDTGPGIPADKLEAIFHPYVSHTTGGTGLGLPTARRIIQEQGGRLTVHSDVGRGSDFVVELPLGEAGEGG